KGHIALLNQQGVARFRNIMIKDLSEKSLDPKPVAPAAPAPAPATINVDKTVEGMAQLQAVEKELSNTEFAAKTAEAKGRRNLKQGATDEIRAAIKAIGEGKRGRAVQDPLDRAREKIQKLEAQIDPASAAKAKGKAAMQKQKGTVGRAETLLNQ